MSDTIDEGRRCAEELERLAADAADPTVFRQAAETLRNVSRLAEQLFEDLDDYGAWMARGAKAIGTSGCPVDQLHAVVHYVETAAPYFHYTPASGELQKPKLDEFGKLPSVFVGPIEIRRNADGTLDEVVADNVSVHLEQMAENAWWMGVSSADDKHLVHVNFWAKSTIEADAEDQHLEE